MKEECKKILTVEKSNLAFRNNVQELADKIVKCFYKCFKVLFVKWSVVFYNNYPESFITNLAESSFSDSVLKFKEAATHKGLYNGASIKTILFAFYRNKLREYIQTESRILKKEKLFIDHFDKGIFTDIEDDSQDGKERLYILLEKALEKMHPNDSKIVLWRHKEEKSNEEIARLLNITKAAATNRIYRCMVRLKLLTQNTNL